MKASRLFLATWLAATLTGPAGAKPASPQSVDYTTLTASKLLDFRYSFPTVIGTYPALLAKIRADRDAVYKSTLADARDDAGARRDQDFPFHQHQLFRDWIVAGNSDHFLSLESHSDDFTGGAHGNHWTTALLWDEKRRADVRIDNLFGGSVSLWNQLRAPYCAKLKAARRSRQVTDATGCPQRKDLTIIPVDSDFNWTFDSLRIVADPYTAGSYAEGTYVIALPITPGLLKSLAPGYRADFEIQRQ